jgi:hypothetical protein
LGSEVQIAKYVRLYADEVGESHFEDLEMALLPVEFAPPPDLGTLRSFCQPHEVFGLAFQKDGQAMSRIRSLDARSSLS